MALLFTPHAQRALRRRGFGETDIALVIAAADRAVELPTGGIALSISAGQRLRMLVAGLIDAYKTMRIVVVVDRSDRVLTVVRNCATDASWGTVREPPA